MNIYQKISVASLIIIFTIGYSYFHKVKMENYFEKGKSSILKIMPKVEITNVFNKKKSNLADDLKTSEGMMIHFWGTWCAPCEFELPSFLEYARKFERINIKFVLIAVNDNTKKIKKFLKRFKLPENVLILHDQNGRTMASFGVIKVPETFFFSKKGYSLMKFIGPQDWDKDSFYDRVINVLE